MIPSPQNALDVLGERLDLLDQHPPLEIGGPVSARELAELPRQFLEAFAGHQRGSGF
jgi:hypothetical protein